MGQPNFLVSLTLAAYVVAVAASFRALEARRAVVVSLLGGWLFLPQFDGRYEFLIVHTKAMAVPAVILAWSLLLDGGRWQELRPRWIDLPILVVSIGPFATALDNDLGAKEAAAAAVEATLTWGAPYALGRAYLGDARGLSELARGLVTASCLYIPPCLWEARMSPHLHQAVYGFRTFSFDQAIRFGGYRPTVFMQHGLAVGMFLAAGSLVAYWLWRTGAVRSWAGLPFQWVTAALVVTTAIVKSTGAIVLLGVGIVALELTRRLRTPALLLLLAAAPAGYAASRIAGWGADEIVELAARATNEDRASSLRFRMENESLLIHKALLRPWLGWGRFGRALIYDEDGQSAGVITDGMWIIAFGFTGLLGLVGIGAVLALPPLRALRGARGRWWGDPRLAPLAALATVLLLWAIDDLANAMMSPVYPAIAGALSCVTRPGTACRSRAGRVSPAPTGTPRGSAAPSHPT